MRIINACLNDLTDRQRAVIALHYGVEMPGEKIGRLLGITAPGVADLHQRALAALRRGLAARGIGRWDEL
ncbi:MAG TPA: sigma factor-like helix-turn-helix DNA-binding protein [Phycisphaerae bacterium]|nr:sigma factor-like helix-turn-helix DNA-binding protein [Phycisphaerae bacterium]